MKPGRFMERIEKTVFISYRRTNVPWALAIFQNLAQHGFDVFFDYEGIASGDFETVILQNIRARAHFLVILTPSALERCNEPGDWLRREIETAFQSRRNIVPLMLEGFDFGTPTIASRLTGTLSPLKRYNALTVSAEYFLAAMERLRNRFLNIPLDAVLHAPSVSARRAAAKQKEVATIALKVKKNDLTAQYWFERGNNAVQLDERICFYSNAIRLEPRLAAAFINRGNVRQLKGDLEGAIADHNEALRLKPDYAEAFSNRGNARLAKGDREGAIADHNEAIRLKPDFAEAFSNRGHARQAMGDLVGAIADYDVAIRLKPDYAQAFINRGVARLQNGHRIAGLQDLNEGYGLRRAVAKRDRVDKAKADASKKKRSRRPSKFVRRLGLSLAPPSLYLSPHRPSFYYLVTREGRVGGLYLLSRPRFDRDFPRC